MDNIYTEFAIITEEESYEDLLPQATPTRDLSGEWIG